MQKAQPKRVRRAKAVAPRRLTLRVSLRDIAPPVWRAISVPDSYSLEQLHRCIQLGFAWLDYHLYEFQVGSRRLERPDEEAEGENAAMVTLAELSVKVGDRFVYLYDMGDYWLHDVEVLSTEPLDVDDGPDLLPYLVGGERAAPPEDAGGPPGYADLVSAFRNVSSADSRELLAWAGPGFNPDVFDLRAGNHSMILASAWGVI
jgi:hypothetical protein